jgi:hypothetical protein
METNVGRIPKWHEKWQHLASPFFFVGGFLLDILTLGRIDDWSNILFFSFYITISFFLFYEEIYSFKTKQDTGLPPKLPFPQWVVKNQKLEYWFHLYKDEVFHFAQGALLSAFTLFYFKSAELSNSLFFMLLLMVPLIINEFNTVREFGLIIKSVFFNLTLMSFVLVYTPLPFGKVGLSIFTLAIVFYLFLIILLMQIFIKSRIERDLIHKFWLIPALALAILFFGLRLFKAIPPVPLSLEKAGIYHNVEKNYPEYKLYHEKKWWRFWDNGDEHFIARPGDRPYFFGRIFAPRGFDDKIYVRWSRYHSGSWHTSDRIPLSITGGRDNGYRGVTYKDNYTPGLWRVSVETSGELEIGRLSFEIIADEAKDNKEPRKFKVEVDN